MSDSILTVGLENICFSGGAEGADLQWGMMAGRNNFSVIHWSFDGHKVSAPECEVVRLSQPQLDEADSYLRRANKTLKRKFPTSNQYTNNLLRRSWYQVSATNAVYAVGTKDHLGNVDGGTAWAVQMYMDRFLIDKEPIENCKLYFFDQSNHAWWQWNGEKWYGLSSGAPRPSGVWTGIGSRNLTDAGKWAIRKLLGNYIFGDEQIASMYPTITEPKIGDKIYIPCLPAIDWAERLGGVATIQSIQTGKDDLYISVLEFGNPNDIRWSSIRDLQVELRLQYKMTRASYKTRN
jgi:hypothetical protein